MMSVSDNNQLQHYNSLLGKEVTNIQSFHALLAQSLEESYQKLIFWKINI
jgi:hypothetical protein